MDVLKKSIGGTASRPGVIFTHYYDTEIKQHEKWLFYAKKHKYNM